MNSYNKKIKSYFNNNKTYKKHEFIFGDEKTGLLLTDTYSIIKLVNCNNVTNNRFLNINKDFKRTENEQLNDSVIYMFDKFNEQNFCNNSSYEKISKDFIKVNNISDFTFHIPKIEKIKKLISKNDSIDIFTSKDNKNTICLTGAYGYAYLLGCKTY